MSAASRRSDVDGDSRVDLAALEPDGTLMVSTRGSTFEEFETFDTGLTDAGALAIADLDGDHRGDLVVTPQPLRWPLSRCCTTGCAYLEEVHASCLGW